jgi:hypothetical protein
MSPVMRPSLLAAESCPNLVIVRGGSFTEADGRTAPRIHLAGPLSKPVEMVSHGPYQLFGLYLWPWGTKRYLRWNRRHASTSS